MLTSSSFFGKYLPHQNNPSPTDLSTINLRQNYIHERPFVSCKFDTFANRLYLLDSSGTLVSLSLLDNSFSTLKGKKIHNFTVDGNNSLSILYVTPNSQVYQVGFDNKKPNKVLNLNMNRVITFERNYLRDMILCLDYKLLFLFDVTKSGTLNSRSLKAKGQQIFTNACFSSNNRYIILILKHDLVRIVQIMNFKTIHQVKLPFHINNIKLEVSYDSKKIAIYGESKHLFLITLIQNQTYSYEYIELPFTNSITQVRYTSENDLLILASDQILYGISHKDLQKAVPLFNEQLKTRMMNFDVSLDCKKVAMVSNRNVMQIKFKDGLKYQIQNASSFKRVNHSRQWNIEQKQEQNNCIEEVDEREETEQKKIEYEDEQEQQEEQQQSGRQEKIQQSKQNLINVAEVYKELSSNYRISTKNIPIVNETIQKINENNSLSEEDCLKVMKFALKAFHAQKQKIKQYGLIIIPEIVAILQKKFRSDFTELCQTNILTLFLHYFQKQQWKQVLNWLIENGVNQRTSNLPLFYISILQEIASNSETQNGNHQLLLNSLKLNISFENVYSRLVKTYIDQKYKLIFSTKQEFQSNNRPSNERVVQEKANSNRLQELISKQDEINKALAKLKKTKA